LIATHPLLEAEKPGQRSLESHSGTVGHDSFTATTRSRTCRKRTRLAGTRTQNLSSRVTLVGFSTAAAISARLPDRVVRNTAGGSRGL
jgi:hypothetical protein